MARAHAYIVAAHWPCNHGAALSISIALCLVRPYPPRLPTLGWHVPRVCHTPCRAAQAVQCLTCRQVGRAGWGQVVGGSQAATTTGWGGVKLGVTLTRHLIDHQGACAPATATTRLIMCPGTSRLPACLLACFAHPTLSPSSYNRAACGRLAEPCCRHLVFRHAAVGAAQRAARLARHGVSEVLGRGAALGVDVMGSIRGLAISAGALRHVVILGLNPARHLAVRQSTHTSSSCMLLTSPPGLAVPPCCCYFRSQLHANHCSRDFGSAHLGHLVRLAPRHPGTHTRLAYCCNGVCLAYHMA